MNLHNWSCNAEDMWNLSQSKILFCKRIEVRGPPVNQSICKIFATLYNCCLMVRSELVFDIKEWNDLCCTYCDQGVAIVLLVSVDDECRGMDHQCNYDKKYGNQYTNALGVLVY